MNENVNSNIEAGLVENRVSALRKEEERMIKKIEEARRQAIKLMET